MPYVVTLMNWTHMFKVIYAKKTHVTMILDYVLKTCSIILGSVGEAIGKVCVITRRESIGAQLGYALTVLIHKMTSDLLHTWL